MRIVFFNLLICATIFLNSCTSRNEEFNIKNDLKELNLKGKVKSLKVNSFIAIEVNGEIFKGNKPSEQEAIELNIADDSYKSFNTFGNEIHHISYSYNGNVKRETENIYDSEQNLIEFKSYYPDGITYFPSNKTIFKSHKTYTYDSRGNCLEMIEYDSEGKVLWKTNKIYENSDLIDSYDYDNFGKLIYHLRFKYDKNHNQIETTSFNPDGSIGYSSKDNYDLNGKLTERIHLIKGILESRLTFLYDIKGNLIEQLEYDSSNNIHESNTYQYDEKNQLFGSKKVYTSHIDNKLKHIENKYKYDENEEIIYNNVYWYEDNLNYKYEYKLNYDEFNNWINKIIFINGIAKYIIDRQNEYY